VKETRKIQKAFKSQPAIEGAGVHLKRAFGFNEVPEFDPFLLLDDFRSSDPRYYLAGFPWHPHRGIETITYMVDGYVEHGDSLGNKGIISTGDVQWMTAGSGIIHQEMPKGDDANKMGGFQLWANLPAAQKMTDPRYREVKKDQIPVVALENGTMIRVVCGKVADKKGPVEDIFIEPEYLDVTIPSHAKWVHPVKRGHTVFAYVIRGSGFFDRDTHEFCDNETLVLFNNGDEIMVSTTHAPVRFLLISGSPLMEPVAWRGPIVMNTHEELRVAFEEYQQERFIKHGQGG
jgi:redox-sensitive bicupin YhaK (pirin superfamily)